MDHIRKLHEMGLPIVFFDRVVPNIKTHSVVVDNFKGGYDATTHLLQNGYTKIAAIAGSEFLSITSERLSGYLKALENYNLQPDEKYIKHCFYGGMREFEVETVLDDLMSLQNRPDAIFTTSDILTTGSLSYLRNRKIIVPDEVALIGFLNSDIANLLNPSLSTIKQPAIQMGKSAAKLLLQLIKSKRPVTEFEKKVLVPELIIRDSTKAKKRI